MSKKQLLNESEIRRFMKLANLEPLTKNVVSEMAVASQMQGARSEDAMKQEMKSMDNEERGLSMEAEDSLDVEVENSVDPKMQALFKNAVENLASTFGIDVEVEGGEDGEEASDEEMPDLDMADDEGGEDSDEMGDEEGGEEASDEEDEELEETLSEDSLVEAVLARVSARLVAEAKKKKMSIKEKMKKKKEMEEYKKKKVVEEATSAEGGGPLLKQGKNKYDPWKGHADMSYAKGKEGKGGHQMEVLPAKSEHTVTHGGKNLATLGGNKTKV